MLAVGLSGHLGGGWGFFTLLLLAPDLMASGSLAGSHVGAWTYDLAHTPLGPVALGAASGATGSEAASASR